MRSTIIFSDEAATNLVALSSYLSFSKYGGSAVSQGAAIREALNYYFENDQKAAAHRAFLETYK